MILETFLEEREKEMTNDMTVGKPLRAILTMSVPILLGNLFQQFYNMADTIIVGRFLGRNALAAVGSTSSLYFLVLWFITDMMNGFAVKTAQRFGAGDYEGMRKSVGLTVVLSTIVTVFLTVVSTLAVRSLLILMQTPEEILEEAYVYILVIFLGLLATMLYNMASAILRALGDGRTPLYFLLLTSGLNIVLDLLFVCVFKAGTAGAAAATVLSQAVSGVLCICYMYRKFSILHLKKTDFAVKPGPALELLKMGVPMGLMGSLTAIGIIILQFAINTFGTAAMAAYTAATKVEQMACMPLAAYSVAMTNFVGQNYGAGKIANIRKGIRQGMGLTLATAVLMCGVVLCFGRFFAGLFLESSDVEVIRYAVGYQKVIGCFLPLFGVICIMRRCLQGVGDSTSPMLAGIMETVSRIAWTLWLAKFGSFEMVAWVNGCTWVIAAGGLFLMYRRNMGKVYYGRKSEK